MKITAVLVSLAAASVSEPIVVVRTDPTTTKSCANATVNATSDNLTESVVISQESLGEKGSAPALEAIVNAIHEVVPEQLLSNGTLVAKGNSVLGLMRQLPRMGVAAVPGLTRFIASVGLNFVALTHHSGWVPTDQVWQASAILAAVHFVGMLLEGSGKPLNARTMAAYMNSHVASATRGIVGAMTVYIAYMLLSGQHVADETFVKLAKTTYLAAASTGLAAVMDPAYRPSFNGVMSEMALDSTKTAIGAAIAFAAVMMPAFIQ